MSETSTIYNAELALLASVLLDDSALHRVRPVITADSFSDRRHSLIWTAIEALESKHRPIEPTALAAEMETSNTLEAIGGRDYFLVVMAAEYSGINATEYARIISEAADKRRLWVLGQRVCQHAADAAIEATAITLMVRQEIDTISAKARVRARAISEVVSEVFTDILSGKGAPVGLRTGFHRLDALTNGFQPGQFIIIAARPSAGKSTLALNFAQNASLADGKHTLFFSLEMSGEEIGKSCIAATSGIDVRRLKRGALEEEVRQRLTDSAQVLSSNNFKIVDESGLTLGAIRAEAMALHARRPLDLVIVDYVQLIGDEPRARIENNQMRIAKFSAGLKALAKDLMVPVVLLCQLNREVERRENGTPTLADLRDSGSLEQDADIVLALHRPMAEDEKNPAKTALTVLKHRTGERNVFIPLLLHKSESRFEEDDRFNEEGDK